MNCAAGESEEQFREWTCSNGSSVMARCWPIRAASLTGFFLNRADRARQRGDTQSRPVSSPLGASSASVDSRIPLEFPTADFERTIKRRVANSSQRWMLGWRSREIRKSD